MNSDNAVYQIFETQDKNEYEHYAALDIGSNSFHLVIARVVEGAVQIVNKVKHKVRLAEGLDHDFVLSDEFIERGLDTLAAMTPTLQGLPRRKVRVVATYTLRRAKNARAFQRAAKRVFPYPIEIISGAEEARLIYVGINSGINETQGKLIFDIGGGSTEFAVGSGNTPDICKSINMGCVSYQKTFFADGNISHNACEAAITEAKQELELATRKLKEFSWEKVYASSGTAKAIANVIQGNENGEPTKPVTKQELQLLLAQCIEKGSDKALAFTGLTEERKPVFAAGICIMLATFQSLSIDEMHYSQNALREGVLIELQPNKTNQNVCLNTAQSMARRYSVDTEFAHHVLRSCMHIYNAVKTPWHIDDPQLRFVLGWASLLHEIGMHINAKGIQRHSGYIIQNADMPGFNTEQQLIIATLVRFHRKRIRAKDFPEFVNVGKEHIEKILAILRLAIVLNINRHASILPQETTVSSDNALRLIFDPVTFAQNPLLSADLKREIKSLESIDIKVDYITVKEID